jgi:isocitrate dehydrogenase kinase/phosphatase
MLQEAQLTAQFLQQRYEQFYQRFNELTEGAKSRFEKKQWHEQREAVRERILLHDEAIERIAKELSEQTKLAVSTVGWWKQAGEYFDKATCHNPLARTFFDAVGRIFFKGDLALSLFNKREGVEPLPLLLSYYLVDVNQSLLEHCLMDIGFQILNQKYKAKAVLEKIQLLTTLPAEAVFYPHLFYRNKHAYWLGYLKVSDGKIPLCFAFAHTEEGIELNAVLTTEEELKNVFAFSRSYFLVSTNNAHALIQFLLSLMPSKPESQLFMNLGYQEHGKELVVHHLQQHLQQQRTQFMVAPGIPGMVMMVFTLPDYDLVFKLIRDNFRPPKSVSREEVIEKYRFIALHDRVGRLADAQRFEYLGLPLAYFEKDLLDYLLRECSQSVSVRSGLVCFQDIYTERKMIPLNIYLNAQRAVEENNHAVIDFGNAVREMAMSNIFPGDLLIKNFGVTNENRVVFYDYDEILPLASCQFKDMPKARNDDEEMSAEPWYAVSENDIFPQELVKFLLPEGDWRNLFAKHHQELYTAKFWNDLKALHESGALVDIQPYEENL